MQHLPRSGFGPAALFLAVLWSGNALAQTPPPDTAPTPDTTITPQVERISHEDELSRIDELRVGGQTRSISVQPKNGAPAYEVVPSSAGADPSAPKGQSSGNAGRSRWPVLSF